jgi:nucleotide-binding universal stress UspA family protein
MQVRAKGKYGGFAMERHVLITISEQLKTIYGVRFVGHFFSNKQDLEVTLLYIAPRPAAVWEGEQTHDSVRQAEEQAKRYESKGHEALEAAKKELQMLGFGQKQVSVKLQIRKFSKVADIIQEAEKGLYDAVALGPRGLSWLERAFDESVSRALLEKKANFPVWTCRKLDQERKNVLLCVDGSDPAKRIADHVGFMLAEERNHVVTLFLVRKKGAALKKGEDTIVASSREALSKNGFPEHMINTKLVEASDVAKAILKEAERGRFAVVAVGRTGTGQGLTKKLFMGSVSDTLFHELEGAALWICH